MPNPHATQDRAARYRTIVMDPPWHYEGFARFRGPGTVRANGPSDYTRKRFERPDVLPYPSMTIAEIKLLPIPSLAAEDCALWMWTTQRFLPDALDIVRGYGFAYKQLLTWRKGGWSPFGGSIAPNDVELVVFSKRGKPQMAGRLASCVFDGKGNTGRRAQNAPAAFKHSRKPEAFLDMVETVSPEPRVELFARRQRLGWDTWGNEALEHVEVGA